jgi:hypothetical protein
MIRINLFTKRIRVMNTSRIWRIQNPEKSLEHSRKWRRENSEKAREVTNRSVRVWRRKNPEKRAAMEMKRTNRKKYGPDYDRDVQLASQDGACAICGTTDCTWKSGFSNVWHTDHKHGQEGTHRGVLCGRCNTALGNLEPHMDKVIAYLAKYAAEQGASTEGSVT